MMSNTIKFTDSGCVEYSVKLADGPQSKGAGITCETDGDGHPSRGPIQYIGAFFVKRILHWN